MLCHEKIVRSDVTAGLNWTYILITSLKARTYSTRVSQKMIFTKRPGYQKHSFVGSCNGCFMDLRMYGELKVTQSHTFIYQDDHSAIERAKWSKEALLPWDGHGYSSPCNQSGDGTMTFSLDIPENRWYAYRFCSEFITHETCGWTAPYTDIWEDTNDKWTRNCEN